MHLPSLISSPPHPLPYCHMNTTKLCTFAVAIPFRALLNQISTYITLFRSQPSCEPLVRHSLHTVLLFSHVSDSSWPHGLQNARLPCPSPSPRVCSDSCPLSCDAIQPSHPLPSFSPSAFNLSQHRGLFQWVSSSHQVAKVLEFQLRHLKYWSFSFSFQWIFRTDFL